MRTLPLLIMKSLLLPLYYISKLFPRNKYKWVFGEPHGFNNNSKYLFLEVIEKHPDIDAVWIGNKQTTTYLTKLGLPAIYKYSIKGLWRCLTSKVYIVSWLTNDINFYTSRGACVVNLWHGIGWKQSLWVEPKNEKYNPKKHDFNFKHFIKSPVLYYPPSIILSSSNYYSEHVFNEIFNVDRSRCVESMYPRCSFMIQDKNKILTYLKQFGFNEQYTFLQTLNNYNKVILYTPTFRDDNSDFIAQSGILFQELNEDMHKTNSLFILKLHPNTNFDSNVLKDYQNIVYLDNTYDTYPLMPFTDIMISDYSSILVDYMLLHKPIVIYAFDYENYICNCRDLIIDFKTATKGLPVVYNFSSLRDLLNSEQKQVDKDLYSFYWQPKYNLIDYIKEYNNK